MFEDFSLIILTYNRKKYLARLLEYYRNAPFRILIADSSDNKNEDIPAGSNFSYLYFPGIPLNKKINTVLKEVKTPFCAFCGDDDFLVMNGIQKCLGFLKTNQEYSIAHGYRVLYLKQYLDYNKLQYNLMFADNLDFSVEDNEPLARVENFFKQYKSVFYGIHKTENLLLAFSELYTVTTNNYLNEYVTGIVPVAMGKYKEINCLYNVLESSITSDGNIAKNLAVLFNSEDGKQVLNSYIDHQSNALIQKLPFDKAVIKKSLEKSLHDLSDKLQKEDAVFKRGSFKKRIGRLVYKIGPLGKWIIQKNRNAEIKSAKSILPFTDKEDIEELERIGGLIMKYGFIQ